MSDAPAECLGVRPSSLSAASEGAGVEGGAGERSDPGGGGRRAGGGRQLERGTDMASREITAFGFLSVSKEITGGSLLSAAACVCSLADVLYCFLFFFLLPHLACSRGDASRVMVTMLTFTSDSGSAWFPPAFPPSRRALCMQMCACLCVCRRGIRARLFRSIINSGGRNGHLAVNLPLGVDQVINSPPLGHRGGLGRTPCDH